MGNLFDRLTLNGVLYGKSLDDPEFVGLVSAVMSIIEKTERNWWTYERACPVCGEMINGWHESDLEKRLVRHFREHSLEDLKACVIEHAMEQS